MESSIEIVKVMLVDNSDGTGTVTVMVEGDLSNNYIPIEATISNARIKGGKVTCVLEIIPKKIKLSTGTTDLMAVIPLSKEQQFLKEEFVVEIINSNNAERKKEKAIRRLRHTSRSKGLKAYLG